MGLVAEFEAASSELFLTPTLEALEDLQAEVERQYAIDPDRPIAFCWLRDDDPTRLERALDRDATVDTYQRIEETAHRALYRVRRSRSPVIEAYGVWVELGAELLRSRGQNGRWEMRMRFPSREAFTDFHTFLEGAGVEFDLTRLADGAVPYGSAHELTPRQRDALRLAYEEGFYDVPRGTTLADLARTLDVSDQAVSERLRRGQARLIEAYVE